jgi:hypothetical protein
MKGKFKDYLMGAVASPMTTSQRPSAAMRLPIRLIAGQPLYQYKGTVQRVSPGYFSLLHHHLPETIRCNEVTNQKLVAGQPLYPYKGTVQRLSLGCCCLPHHHLSEAVSCNKVTNQKLLQDSLCISIRDSQESLPDL